jgi:hypothetical protein
LIKLQARLDTPRPFTLAESKMTTGYMHPDYAKSLAEFGTARFLPESCGWILERQIPDSCHLDAMGCYPLFACHNWSRLPVDLENIGNNLVSLSVVTDPFGEYDPADLTEWFPDLVIPFKKHFVVDLSRAPVTFVHSHHRRNARKALREMRVEKCDSPLDFLEDWTNLYATLVERHEIKGMTAFSRESFARQLRVPGIVMLRAVHNDATVGMLLWYGQGNRAYYHLGAYNSRGYELGASFALFDYSIGHFAEHGFEWLNLGSGAGIGGDQGLSRFKEGWSTGVRTAYFCGRIFDPDRYQKILEMRGQPPTRYFPAYRAGEFS